MECLKNRREWLGRVVEAPADYQYHGCGGSGLQVAEACTVVAGGADMILCTVCS